MSLSIECHNLSHWAAKTAQAITVIELFTRICGIEWMQICVKVMRQDVQPMEPRGYMGMDVQTSNLMDLPQDFDPLSGSHQDPIISFTSQPAGVQREQQTQLAFPSLHEHPGLHSGSPYHSPHSQHWDRYEHLWSVFVLAQCNLLSACVSFSKRIASKRLVDGKGFNLLWHGLVWILDLCATVEHKKFFHAEVWQFSLRTNNCLVYFEIAICTAEQELRNLSALTTMIRRSNSH